MEEVRVNGVRSLIPVLVDVSGESLLAYVDMRNRSVLNSQGVRMHADLEEQVLGYLKVPVVKIPDKVYESLEQRKHIDYSRGRTKYAQS